MNTQGEGNGMENNGETSSMQMYFNALMAVAKKEDLQGSGILTVGELREKLDEMMVPGYMVVVEFDGKFVRFGQLDSYRGYYSDLAIDPYSDWSEGIVSVEAAMQTLYETVGEVFTGYKGGEYKMGWSTPVWVSAYGDNSGVGVTGVRLTTAEEQAALYPPMVVIETAKCGS